MIVQAIVAIRGYALLNTNRTLETMGEGTVGRIHIKVIELANNGNNMGDINRTTTKEEKIKACVAQVASKMKKESITKKITNPESRTTMI